MIKSQFKDYYDFVANQYGGGDPRLVYARTRITPMVPGRPWEERLNIEIKGCKLIDPNRYRQYYLKQEPDLEYLYLVIAGKAYLLARPTNIYLDRQDLNTYKLRVVNQADEKIPLWIRYNRGIEFDKEYPFLIDLCRKVKAPVFVIVGIEYSGPNYEAVIQVCGRCPILGNLGIPALINPYQMYQELSMFMGNKMKDTPDTQPPVELDNKNKIIKAGFDLVKSFRHRV